MGGYVTSIPTRAFGDVYSPSGTTAANPATPAGTALGDLAAASGGRQFFGLELPLVIGLGVLAAVLIYAY